MTTEADVEYNGASAQTVYIPLRCPITGKLITRISHTGAWPDDLHVRVWCRGCHYEHEVTRETVEEARAHDANNVQIHRAPVREALNTSGTRIDA